MLLLLTVKAKTKAQLQMAVYQIGSMATNRYEKILQWFRSDFFYFKILIKNRPTYLNKNLNTVKRETELKKG